MGQAAREAFGLGGEYRTALPNDIVQLEQKAADLKRKYQGMTDRAYVERGGQERGRHEKGKT